MDNLTGFKNRYSFNEFTDDLSKRRTGESWIISKIDMDNTRKLNSTYGHLEGDNALRSLAAVIKSCVKKTDFAARYDGDEFVLASKLKNGQDRKNVENYMKDIKDALSRHNEKSQKPYKIGIVYGYGVYTADGNISINDFMKDIDDHMHREKEDRRRTGDAGGIV